MVLESLLGFELKKPTHLFITGIFFSTIAVLISSSLFANSPSMVVVTFMTLPSVYVFTNILNNKGKQEEEATNLKEEFMLNVDVVKMYLYLFLGMSVGIAIWFNILPQASLANLFAEQIFNLKQIGAPTAFAINDGVFWLITVNNVKLVFLCFILSFIFGSGALFILAWNASVVGVAVGMIGYNAQSSGAAAPVAALQGISMGASFYLLHLVPEVVAYFVAAVAGAYVSYAMMNRKMFTEKSNKLLMISGILMLVSVGLIFFGAVVETGISHVIQSQLR